MTGIFFFALGFLLLPASLVRSAWMSLLCSLPPPPDVPPTHFPQPFSFMALGCPKSRTLALSPLCACMTKKDQGSRKRMVTPNGQCSSPFPLPPPLSSTLPHPPFLLYFFLLPLSASFPLLSSPSLPYPGRAKWLRQNGFARTARAREKVSTQPQKESGMGGEDRGRQRLFHFSSLFLVLSFPKGEVSFFTRDIPTYHAAECCGRGKQRGPQTTAIFRK